MGCGELHFTMIVLSSANPLLEVWFYISIFLFNRKISMYWVIYSETVSVLKISASWHKVKRTSEVKFSFAAVMVQLLNSYFFGSCVVLNLILPVTRCNWNKNVKLDFSVATSINTSCRIRSIFVLEQTWFTVRVSYLI